MRAAKDESGAAVDVHGAERRRSRRSGRRCPSAVVISTANTSCRRPAIALPSSISASISASRRSEALGLDPARLVPELDQRLRDRLDERRRAADVDLRPLVRRRRRPRRASPRRRGARSPSSRAAASGSGCGRRSSRRLQALELVAVDDVVPAARGEEEPHLRVAARPRRGGGSSPSAARCPIRRRRAAPGRPAAAPRRSSRRSVRAARSGRRACSSSVRYGETSPSSSRSTVSSTRVPSGADAIE